MYLKSFKIRYPEPTEKFVEKELDRYIEANPDDNDAQYIRYKIMNNLVISRMSWFKLRKRVAEWKDRKQIEYLTSPESETYHCS